MLSRSPGLIKSLREEVELWKSNYRQQVEAAANEAPNGKSFHDASNSESETLRQEIDEARQEAALWKGKALESQEMQSTSCLVSNRYLWSDWSEDARTDA